MKINLLDIDTFIAKNSCMEVSDPVHFDNRTPREDGLFSTKVFGEVGTRERLETFGYIELNSKFFNPIIYKLLDSIDKKTKEIISGNLFVSLDKDGYIIEDEQRGSTGIDFYVKNWKKIAYKTTDSESRKTKLKVIQQADENLIFLERWLVMPAGLRDYNLSDSSGALDDMDTVNEMYAKIIRLTRGLKSSSFGFVTNNTRYQVQESLTEIYEKLVLNDLAKKGGMFRKSLMGKSIDYATRSVITAPNVYAKRYNEQEVPFGYTGVPLSQVIVLFYPFFSKYIRDFVDTHRDNFTNIQDGEREIYIEDVDEQFNDDNITKMLDSYIKSRDGRFDRIRVKNKEDGKLYPVKVYNESLGRDFTITDLLYIAAIDICSNKHVYVTRYPVGSFLNIYPSKIRVLSTTKTQEVQLDDRLLKNYPVVYPDYPIEHYTFIDTVRINNSYAAALGADFDGDQVSLRGIFTNEANEETAKLINSKTMILDQSGSNTRELGNDGLMSLYILSAD